ncbi:hypothetical protein IE81DRAFT_340192 [Ceraceosorus guamensis]|uniref:Uncharacterized protein n=1 Tax=Ceraceosorus guamensis TaxID=1522189 RepID=A0A316W3Q9_9BASI|nr:hypothetical protein IE81DRAFT_340192 [Ceraceosorus guamensis]PWN44349.1 hypothetical protein IE81DRAFT_340192 [Ceraceosorus guamensis]
MFTASLLPQFYQHPSSILAETMIDRATLTVVTKLRADAFGINDERAFVLNGKVPNVAKAPHFECSRGRWAAESTSLWASLNDRCPQGVGSATREKRRKVILLATKLTMLSNFRSLLRWTRKSAVGCGAGRVSQTDDCAIQLQAPALPGVPGKQETVRGSSKSSVALLGCSEGLPALQGRRHETRETRPDADARSVGRNKDSMDRPSKDAVACSCSTAEVSSKHLEQRNRYGHMSVLRPLPIAASCQTVGVQFSSGAGSLICEWWGFVVAFENLTDEGIVGGYKTLDPYGGDRVVCDRSHRWFARPSSGAEAVEAMGGNKKGRKGEGPVAFDLRGSRGVGGRRPTSQGQDCCSDKPRVRERALLRTLPKSDSGRAESLRGVDSAWRYLAALPPAMYHCRTQKPDESPRVEHPERSRRETTQARLARGLLELHVNMSR